MNKMHRTAKHRVLVEDPVIKYKPVESLPGISPVYGRRLRENGYNTADQLLAQYIALKRNEQRFVAWMSMTSGSNAHTAALCFSGLNDWYNTWRRDVQIPVKSYSPSPNEKGTITNRMLLEQKMLQYNSSPNEDRLRSLFCNQTTSLVDLSKSSERPSFTLERLNKSYFNINDNFEVEKRLKKSPSPISKSVNFKENVEFNNSETSRWPSTSYMPNKRPKSPILKTRSLTPEIGASSKKTNVYFRSQSKIVNNKNEVRKKNSSMNNLNITGKKHKSEFNKSKSIENMYRNNTFTKTKGRSIKEYYIEVPSDLVCTCDLGYRSEEVKASKKRDLEQLICTCDFPDGQVDEAFNSKEVDNIKAPQNIQEYFVEKRNKMESQKSTNNLRNNETSKCVEPEKPKIAENQCESKEVNTDSNEIQNKESYEEQQSVSTLSEDENRNDRSLKYIAFTDGDSNYNNNDRSVILDSRDLENLEVDTNSIKVDVEHEIEFLEKADNFSLNSATFSKHENEASKEKCSEFLQHKANQFYNFNDDSGLDVTTKSNSDCNEYLTETHDDECSMRSVDSDRTFEVTDSTDAESGFYFASTKLKTLDELESVKETGAENEIENPAENQHDDELKRKNIRLFCDMLSNDLEHLPMENFRKLKLKILEMVYAEIDQFGVKKELNKH